jgi:hypothetical protein
MIVGIGMGFLFYHQRFPALVVSCSPTIAVLNLLVFMAVNSPGFPQINCMLHIQPHFRKGIRLKPGSPRASEKLAVSSTSNRAWNREKGLTSKQLLTTVWKWPLLAGLKVTIVGWW